MVAEAEASKPSNMVGATDSRGGELSPPSEVVEEADPSEAESATPRAVSSNGTNPLPTIIDVPTPEPAHTTSHQLQIPARDESIQAPRHRSPSPTPYLQTLFQGAIEASNPHLRLLASHSSYNSQTSRHSSESRSERSPVPSFRPLSTTFKDQRHEGKRGLSITSKTKIFEPGLLGGEESRGTTLRESWGSGSLPGAEKKLEAGNGGIPEENPTDPPSASLELATEEESTSGVKEEDIVYPKPLALSFLIIGIALSVFLISLDRTIITTAIPYITNEFNSSDDIGWYGSAYLLTASAFQPLYGRIFMLFNMKWSYLTALGLFELGSLICGIAPSSMALIIGRAIAGLGSAGILTGSFVVVANAVPLARRPLLTAVVGLMFGVGATAGPLLGGVFTDLVTWRWCFYINLPVGGTTVAAMVLFFHPPRKHALMGKSFLYRVMELDLIGNAVLLAASIMLFLAFQFTEQQMPWGSAEVVGLLTGSGVTFILFSVWQWWKADGALMPPRILKQRSVAAACAMSFCIYSAILIHTYYLPMWFQAIKGDSAIHAGVNMIPYVAANAIFSLIAGIFVSKNGYFTAPAILGCALGTVGCGLLSTIDASTSTSKWIGYEILASVGIGMAIQQGFTAIQIVLPLDEVAIGTAAVVAFQSLGGAIFVSVGNTILQNSLLTAGRSNRLPGVDVQAVISAGASEFRKKVTAEQLPALIDVYNKALQKVFIAAIPMAGLAMLSALFLEWRSVDDKKKSADEEILEQREKRKKTEKMILEANRELPTRDGVAANPLEIRRKE
ncbi:Efflux pump roqT [Lachnellula arida]|uniref:Efflux pump roqT n=1 Tax=Lachnellula arida TaxID=1316785 RepID=A0A8T9BCZ2_9HELO|nr:Efflux pump roqT [Lachnellula arida]